MSVRSVFPPRAVFQSATPADRTSYRSFVGRPCAGWAGLRATASCACGVLATGARARRRAGGRAPAAGTARARQQQRKRKTHLEKSWCRTEILLSLCSSICEQFGQCRLRQLNLQLRGQRSDASFRYLPGPSRCQLGQTGEGCVVDRASRCSRQSLIETTRKLEFAIFCHDDVDRTSLCRSVRRRRRVEKSVISRCADILEASPVINSGLPLANELYGCDLQQPRRIARRGTLRIAV